MIGIVDFISKSFSEPSPEINEDLIILRGKLGLIRRYLNYNDSDDDTNPLRSEYNQCLYRSIPLIDKIDSKLNSQKMFPSQSIIKTTSKELLQILCDIHEIQDAYAQYIVDNSSTLESVDNALKNIYFTDEDKTIIRNNFIRRYNDYDEDAIAP